MDEIGPREWERLEDDEAFKEGFLLAINNVSLKINEIEKNWRRDGTIPNQSIEY